MTSPASDPHQLEAVFANASAAFAILRGPEFIYEKANPSYLNLFLNRSIVGRRLLEALPELRGQKFPELIRKVYETGQPYAEVEAVAYLSRTADSPVEKRYFDQSYIRITDDEGRNPGVLIQAIDVTERVIARELLAEGAERFQRAVYAANLGTWDLDLRTGLVDWSPRTCELFGVPYRNLVPLETALTRIHPDDQRRAGEAIAAATDPNGDGHYKIEYRILHDDESVRWVSLLGQCLFEETSEGRRARRFSGTVLDVTERVLSEQAIQRSEEQFRRLADLMPQVVWTAKPDGMLDYTNARWTQYSGSDAPHDWLNFVHPDDQARSTESWLQSVATGEPYQTEFRLLRAVDQSYRWFLVRAHAARDAFGEIERWFGTCTDIESQKRELAERSNFISIASHELKTPLTSLKLQTQSMRRNYEKRRPEAFTLDKVQLLIANNEKQVGRLIRLVDDMLDFSKIESGKLSITLENVDLVELVREVHDRLREQLEAAGCETFLIAGGPLLVTVDRFRIEQVVTNLLTNALRYGQRKPVEIRVGTSEGAAHVTVSDQGMGIAADDLERIFRRFERAVSANEVSGLGLGLFISREIIEAHGGTLTVKSTLGKGAQFRIGLPVEGKNAK